MKGRKARCICDLREPEVTLNDWDERTTYGNTAEGPATSTVFRRERTEGMTLIALSRPRGLMSGVALSVRPNHGVKLY